jgi:phosphoribosylformimino-5-aminoimidazole carboxamide ribotide isomerase
MRVVPVIDVLDGRVVRAVRGERSAYRSVESALCRSSDPLRVAAILLAYCGSRKLYIADHDALTGRAPQADVIAALLGSLPDATLWLDAGFATREDALERIAALGVHASRVTPVFGSESLRSPGDAAGCFADREWAILSLDQRNGRRLDPASCWSADALWPSRVIVMTLDRVGAFAGPDLAAFADIRRRAPQAAVIGAGGIRDSDDLAAASRAGAHEWLVASALHDLRIPAADAA